MHLTSLVHDLPNTINVQQDQWQATLVKRPELARYSSVAALSAKYKAIRALFPGGGTPCSCQLLKVTFRRWAQREEPARC